MHNITTEIIINAPKEAIWKVLMDFSVYPDWNPFITSIRGNVREGDRLQVEIQSPGQKAMSFTPQVLCCEDQREFRWLGKLWMKGLFDGEHFFLLKAISDEQTKLIHGENFSGLLAGILLKMIRESTRQGFIVMNEALKSRAELL